MSSYFIASRFVTFNSLQICEVVPSRRGDVGAGGGGAGGGGGGSSEPEAHSFKPLTRGQDTSHSRGAAVVLRNRVQLRGERISHSRKGRVRGASRVTFAGALIRFTAG